MPCPSRDAYAAAVPLTRKGRSQCSMKAGVNGGDPLPHALRSARRRSQSQSVAMRSMLVYQGGRRRCDSHPPPPPPGSASPSRRTMPATDCGARVAAETATAAPRECPTTSGFLRRQAPLEAADECGPAVDRVRPAPLGEAERGQVERVHAVRPPELEPHLVPHPGGLDEPTEEDDRAAVCSPGAVREPGPVHYHKRTCVEPGGRNVPARRDRVEQE